MSPFLRLGACIASSLAFSAWAAELKVLIAVDPSEEGSGFVYTEEIRG